MRKYITHLDNEPFCGLGRIKENPAHRVHLVKDFERAGDDEGQLLQPGSRSTQRTDFDIGVFGQVWNQSRLWIEISW